MGTMTDIAIIGAGPYGLSLGAHLSAAGLSVRVFGQPMHTWRTSMPEGMVLKSEGFASNLWHPDGALTLKDYCADHGLPYKDSGLPIPLQTFSDYGVAFQKRFVPMLDERWVTGLDRESNAFLLRLDDDEIVTAQRVVIAAGIRSFHYTPAELAALAGPLCSHSIEHHRLERFSGKRVLVVGGGASGVELAALMSKKGAQVTVAARRGRIPYCQPPRPRSLLERIQAPETGLGTGWRSVACVAAPMLFYQMPRDFRHLVVRKHLGPAPGWVSREEVEQNVNVLLGAKVDRACVRGAVASVTFRTSDGTEKVIDAEHVISATGFRVDMQRLNFINPRIMDRLALADQTPLLSPHFETSAWIVHGRDYGGEQFWTASSVRLRRWLHLRPSVPLPSSDHRSAFRGGEAESDRGLTVASSAFAIRNLNSARFGGNSPSHSRTTIAHSPRSGSQASHCNGRSPPIPGPQLHVCESAA